MCPLAWDRKAKTFAWSVLPSLMDGRSTPECSSRAWPRLWQPPPWHCHATPHMGLHGLLKSLLPGPTPALPGKGADLQKITVLFHWGPLWEYCSFLRCIYMWSVSQLCECFGMSVTRARRTRHPKSARLVVLFALKIDKKLGCYAKLYNKLEGSPSAKSKGD